MLWEYLPTIITAVLTGSGTMLGTVLYYRHKGLKQEGESENSHLKTFYETMNSALREQEKRHATDINQIREEQREERKQWALERAALNDKIDKMQEQAREDAKAIHRKDIEVVELRAEVKVLTERLKSAPHAGNASEVNVKLN